MKLLLDIPKEQIPSFHEIARFPKSSSFILACFWMSFPTLLILMLLSGLLGLAFGKPFPASDWVPGLIILLIILAFTVPYFLQEKRRHQEAKKGIHTLGAFFSKDALLWCTNENAYQFIPKTCLKKFELVGCPTSGQNGGVPDYITLHGPDFYVKIDNAQDYKLPDLIQFLSSWKADLTLDIDATLKNYLYVPPKD